ncbi:MAG: hypothetical protein EGP08_02415 [SAR202 cluster bacterium]|nr:MAG: hypothetical protein EGP08_02415 [SAR202 cluster bacterium]MQG74560.1 hypothetical protein [SAR202 cluster bacterium]
MIEIESGPYLANFGSLLISWHGVFSFIAVASAVFLVGRWAPLRGVDPDDIYSIALWAIIGGILGARFVHVIDHLSVYSEDPLKVFAIWSGGIGLWGGILGGFIGGAAYSMISKIPVGLVADLTAPAMLFVQSIGRLGDIVNGEHCAKLTDQFYGFVWRSNDSAASWCANGLNASVQPVIALEIIWNLSVLFVIWKLRNRLRPAGMLFALYLGFYAIGRFLITFLRDDKIWSMGLQEAHFIAIVVLIIVVPLLAFKARFGNPEDVINEFRAIAPQKSRAERRRED